MAISLLFYMSHVYERSRSIHSCKSRWSNRLLHLKVGSADTWLCVVWNLVSWAGPFRKSQFFSQADRHGCGITHEPMLSTAVSHSLGGFGTYDIGHFQSLHCRSSCPDFGPESCWFLPEGLVFSDLVNPLLRPEDERGWRIPGGQKDLSFCSKRRKTVLGWFWEIMEKLTWMRF